MSTQKNFFAGKHYTIYRISLGMISIALLFLFFASCDLGEEGITPPVGQCIADTLSISELGLKNEKITSIFNHPVYEHLIYTTTSWDYSSGSVGKIFISTDCGHSWTIVMEGGYYLDLIYCSKKSNTLYGVGKLPVRSNDYGQSWLTIGNGIHVNNEINTSTVAVDCNNTNLLLAGTVGFFGGKLYKSTDSGNNWAQLSNEMFSSGISIIKYYPVNNGAFYLGLNLSGAIYQSTNFGTSWELLFEGIGYDTRDFLLINNENKKAFVTYGPGGIYQSDDNLTTWIKDNQSILDSEICVKLLYDDTNNTVFLLTLSSIYKRRLNESEWINIYSHHSYPSENLTAIALASNKQYLFVGTTNGLIKLKI
jgi:hypothetical protein